MSLSDLPHRRHRRPRLLRRCAGLRYVADAGPGIRRRRAGRGWAYRQPDGSPVRDAPRCAGSSPWPSPRRGRTSGSAPIPGATCRPPGATPGDASSTATTPAGGRCGTRSSSTAWWPSRRPCPPSASASTPTWPARAFRQRVLATVVRLLQDTLIRVGNDEYRRQNKSFGLTTLRDRHVDVSGTLSASTSGASTARRTT